MTKPIGALLLFCSLGFGCCGCASSIGAVGSPLNFKNRAIAKQAEKDPFPSATQVGLADQ